MVVQQDERGGMGLWQRLVRALFPPSDRESIREDLNDALQSGGELHEAFSADERAMLHNILRLREVRVEDLMVPRADVGGGRPDHLAWPAAGDFRGIGPLPNASLCGKSR